MTRGLAWIGALSFLAPVAVELPAVHDTTTGAGRTVVRVAGGVGSYAFIARGCEGQVVDHLPVKYRDASVAVDQRIGSWPLVVGVRGGVLEDRIGRSSHGDFPEVGEGRNVTTRYVNPHIAIEGLDGGMGAGWVAHEGEFITAGEGARTQSDHPLNDMSWHVRFGRLDRRHLLLQWMESEPLYSGGGYFTATLGGALPNSQVELRMGLGAGGPFEGAGAVAQVSLPIANGLRVDLRGREGFSGNQTAGGVAIGLEYRTPRPHATTPTRSTASATAPSVSSTRPSARSTRPRSAGAAAR